VELDLYKQVLLAVDGTKIRAVNSKANCYTTDVLLKKIATIDRTYKPLHGGHG